ncbi:hypothetical protein JR316_0013095 [Psilocybe cubensis]|uniref:EF-hand domain-containing protein n=2 Tax=Psilocybe cubensis TaxID=181762 RepID=A0A8H8CHJ4_PSICU|nr:hypothetical protein JR316_0013095 [Psilocybe cubensis]KAH9474631.1 hypothetical protein JR316_0013095 [Psilocybe cubensis]
MSKPILATEIPSVHLEIPSITFPEAELQTPIWDDSNSRSPVEASQERLWNELSGLYNSNEALKGDAAALGKLDSERGAKTAEKLDELLDTFMSGANKVLEELSILGNAHPVLAVAIFAFHEVVKLDIARRDNNKKVLIVVLQMQNMLGPIFQLRNLHHEHMPATAKQFHEQRLKELVEIISQDIKLCRSDITHFMNRKFVYKLILAKGYEKKFASHIETFAQRRAELQAVISEYTAIGISTANITLDGISKKVQVADDKLDVIMSLLFRSVDTPREREVFKFLQQNGGPEKCVNDLDLLPKLIAKAGESPKTGKVAVSDQQELEELRKDLSKALSEDLDKVLETHYARFEKVLQVQNNNLKRMSAHLEDQGVLMRTQTLKLGKILDTVTTIMVLEEGKYKTKEIKLKDPEIQRVWARMNLTSSVVKAKVFVLTFRDHIHVDNSASVTPIIPTFSLPGSEDNPSALHVDTSYGSKQTMLNVTANADKESDEWVLEFIDVAYVRPIVEAMDEDGSGFISVQEANRFALARPAGMSLLHWIAYWAAGWHINLYMLQQAIYSTLLQMHQLLPQIHIANRIYVDDYLDNPVITRIEALLRSIKPLPEIKEPKLQEIANTVSSRQMTRLRANLSDMGHVIETRMDATTIAGGFRVETWILPMVNILLQHHLKIMHLAKTVVLDPAELDVHTTSLDQVFLVFDERMNNLEARFHQLHRDVDAQFQSYSYGMFYAAFKNREYNMSDNILMSIQMDEYIHLNRIDLPTTATPDTTILSKQVGKTFEIEDAVVLSTPPPGHISHPIEGMWVGWFFSGDGDPSYIRPFHCVIPPIVENMFSAKAETFFGDVDMVWTIEAQPTHASASDFNIRFDFNPKDSKNFRKQSCVGLYNTDKDAIEGTFVWNNADEPSGLTEDPQTDPLEESNSDSIDANPTSMPIIDLSAEIESIEEVRDHAPAMDDTLPTTEPVSASDTVAMITEDTVVSVGHREIVPEEIVNPEMGPSAETPMSISHGRFYLKRTPVHLFRFRYLLDGPGTPPCWRIWPLARKRWFFAIEAVLSDTRIRMGSRKAFNLALTERREWLQLSMRFDMGDDDVVPSWHDYETISDKEWEAYDTLLSSVPPLYARMYDDLAHYFARREVFAAPVGRATCDVDIRKNEDDVPSAGTSSTQIQNETRRSQRQSCEEQKRPEEKAIGKRGYSIANNRWTTAHLLLLLWNGYIIALLAPLTFFCYQCERINAPLSQGSLGHSRLEHQILRIYDSIEVKPIRLGKDNDVGRQLEDISSNITLLEEKMNKQLEEGEKVKGVVENMARKVGVISNYDGVSTLSQEDLLGGEHLDDINTDLSDIGNNDLVSSSDSEAEGSQVDASAGRLPAENVETGQVELQKRMDKLELKVENIGAKMDTLLNLVQILVSAKPSD